MAGMILSFFFFNLGFPLRTLTILTTEKGKVKTVSEQALTW